MSQVRSGLLIAIIVFAVFAAYAFFAPATYRTSALLVVDSAAPVGSVNLPEPLEAARRLSEAILDRKTLEQLSRERVGSAAPDAQARAASSVRESLAIDTSDAREFSISYKDSNRARAQRVCNQLVHHAMERAPQVLLDRSTEQAVELKRQQQTQELAAFLALHPQIAAEAPAVAGTPPERDPALSAFHAEKSNLEHRVVELESGAGSDNPYLDPAQSNLTLLRRRLAEINSALSARRDALDAKPSANTLSPELRSEWRRLLDAVSQSSSAAQSQSRPTLVARVVSDAPLPGAPIDPNRPLLLFFGIVFGVGLGAAYTLVVRAAQQRRSKSSRPPSPAPAPVASNMQLPSPPAVPSGLGPPVPSPPLLLSANHGPPIVPIPQRQISSSPPRVTAAANGFGNTMPMIKAELTVREAERAKQPSGNSLTPPGPLPRFTSTSALSPKESEAPKEEITPDPAWASAARGWDDQIRAHDVPGFAVVRPRSEPPSVRSSSGGPPLVVERQATSNVPPLVVERQAMSIVTPAAATVLRSTLRPGQMKVTQPLGSFLPDGGWSDPSAGLGASRVPENTPAAPRSVLSPRPTSTPPPNSTYSYISSKPPPPDTSVAIVRPVPSNWRPDPSLNPEARRSICEQLYPLAVDNCLVVGVIGAPDAQDQKSRVSAELALALAESGHPRILLLEADMQRPRVHRVLEVEMPIAAGFSQQLRARIQGSPDPRWIVVGCSPTLHVLAEGMMRSPGLLLSQQFADSVRDLRSYYDFIIIDGPSASLEVESQALDSVADGVVFVCGKAGAVALAPLQSLFGEKKFTTVVAAP